MKTYTYKSLLPKFNTPLPEEISPVDPLPERCFYEKHAKKEETISSIRRQVNVKKLEYITY